MRQKIVLTRLNMRCGVRVQNSDKYPATLCSQVGEGEAAGSLQRPWASKARYSGFLWASCLPPLPSTPWPRSFASVTLLWNKFSHSDPFQNATVTRVLKGFDWWAFETCFLFGNIYIWSLLDRLHITRAYHIAGNYGKTWRHRNPEPAEPRKNKD